MKALEPAGSPVLGSSKSTGLAFLQVEMGQGGGMKLVSSGSG